MRSSLKLRVGEAGPFRVNPWADKPNVMEDDLGGNAYELEGDAGCDGARDGGCWRMRRKPDIPSPGSCSGSIGVLGAGSKPVDELVSKETRSFPSSIGFLVFTRRSPVLRFFGSLRTLGSDSNLSSCETLFLRLVSVEGGPQSVNLLSYSQYAGTSHTT